MTLPRHDRASARIIPIAAALVVFFSAFFRINSPDLGWHLANGEHMVRHHVLHFADPFSFTTEGRSYPPTQWAFEIVVYAVDRLFGAAGIIAGKALLLAVLFHGIGRLLLRERAGPAAAALLLAAALFLTRFRFIARPDIVTFACTGAVLSILYDYRRRRGDRLRFLPLLFVVWVQFHSGALFGILILGATWAGEEISARLGSGGEALAPEERRRLLFWILLSAAATAVNPNHIRYATFAVGHVEDYGKLVIRELRPVAWHLDKPLIAYAVAVGAVVAATLRRDPPALPAIIALEIASLRTVRLFPLFVIVSLPYLARALPLDRLVPARFRAASIAAALFLLVVPALRAAGPWAPGGLYRFGTGVNERLLPVAGAGALERLAPGGNLFNSNLYGGYLIWRFRGKRKVFTDGRSQLHEPTLLWAASHSWEEIIDRYRIGSCLIDYQWIKPRLPGDEMVLVWWDDLSLLFVSREEADRRGLDRYTIRYPVEERERIALLDRREVERDLRRAMAEAPEAALPRFLLASRLGAAGEWGRAETLLAEAARLAPRRGDVRISHGIALARRGRLEEAARELRAGLAREKKSASGWGWLGNVLYERGDRKGAEKSFRRAADLEPESPAYGLALGRLYEREGEIGRARELYRRLAARFPENEEVRRRAGALERGGGEGR